MVKEYVDINVNIDEFAERMIMSGSNIEKIESFGEKVKDIVVGKIVDIEKHQMQTSSL